MGATEFSASGRLALSDGAIFHGRAFGAVGRGLSASAEVVFNTAMTGYQEALTDPSYAGQILTMTAPMIGVYGVNKEDVESGGVKVAGFIVRELARRHSNHRASLDLGSYLDAAGVLGLEGVDTRALTRRLRTEGAMQGVLTDDSRPSDAELVEMARSAPSMAGRNLVPEVGCSVRQTWTEALGDWRPLLSPAEPRGQSSRRLRVLALDCGAKHNILRHLVERGCEVVIIPHDTTAETISKAFDANEFDGLFISNGPGDPAAVESTIATLRALVGPEADQPPPTFGICLGCQLLALSLGARTYMLKFGHRGVNHPVQNRLTDRIEITSQNHGFAVDPESLQAVGAEATHINLNDGTLAGFRSPDRPIFAVQHHPEASPGPHDAGYLFDAFVRMMQDRRPVSAEAMGAMARA
ncbi:MAG: carbamoyl-phosphate synthase small subunit [Phycisphaeraceae bacterium]|nr:MAG: carbamoyl-phosphate synthase small subunit [Phycisphaeraceae bacterium]